MARRATAKLKDARISELTKALGEAMELLAAKSTDVSGQDTLADRLAIVAPDISSAMDGKHLSPSKAKRNLATHAKLQDCHTQYG